MGAPHDEPPVDVIAKRFAGFEFPTVDVDDELSVVSRGNLTCTIAALRGIDETFFVVAKRTPNHEDVIRLMRQPLHHKSRPGPLKFCPKGEAREVGTYGPPYFQVLAGSTLR